MYLSFTDEALMDCIQQGDAQALEVVFNRYYRQLCQFCAIYIKDSDVAEEVIANLFMKVWDNRADSRILNVKSYLFAAAKNLSLNYIQKKKEPVHFIEDADISQQLLQDTNTPFKILSARESYNKILALINLLPPGQRQVLLMTRVDGLCKHEVAGLLGITVRTVETTLYQSLKKLRELIKASPSFNS
ncbi:sigma-70 family RNA polymerase sigma factor [Mucilaginibacter sp.]|uniref:RNA polymerase sigma factor n=1 Tax=Mucilaginibacter sp. TaxID=1882438 RepID=UPI003264F18C